MPRLNSPETARGATGPFRPETETLQTIPPVIGKGAQRLPTGYIVVSSLLAVFVLSLVGVTGYFRLSSDTAVLRQSLLSSVRGTWDKKIALRIGFFTTSALKLAASFFNLPPEPRAALSAVRGAEVGVYRLLDRSAPVDRRAMLGQADRVMFARGWERLVGVVQEGRLVAVYLPRGGVSARRVKCCVLVFNGSDLVVASAHANVEPLLALAEKHVDWRRAEQALAVR
jgi:hypothetical protein